MAPRIPMRLKRKAFNQPNTQTTESKQNTPDSSDPKNISQSKQRLSKFKPGISKPRRAGISSNILHAGPSTNPTNGIKPSTRIKHASDAGVKKRAARSRRRAAKSAKMDMRSLSTALELNTFDSQHDDRTGVLNDETDYRTGMPHDENMLGVEEQGNGGEHRKNREGDKVATTSNVPNVIKAMRQRQSLGSKKGTTKRRAQIAVLERERWRKNWGVLSSGFDGNTSTASTAGSSDAAGPSGVAQSYGTKFSEVSADGNGYGKSIGDEERRMQRWAALRSHIAASMESAG